MTNAQASPRQKPTKPGESVWQDCRTLDTSEARQYAEWELLVYDLKYALRRAELWKAKMDRRAEAGEDIELATSLFRDAVISVVACFDETLPVHIDPNAVYSAVPGGIEYVRWLRDLRNTWVAHRSGPNRHCVTALWIEDESGEYRGIGCLQRQYMGPRPSAANDLLRVINVAIEHAKREALERRDVLGKKIGEMKPRDRLRLPRASTTIPGSKETHMGRRKFQNIKKGKR